MTVEGGPVVAAPGRFTVLSIREKLRPMAGVLRTSLDTGTPRPATTSTRAS